MSRLRAETDQLAGAGEFIQWRGPSARDLSVSAVNLRASALLRDAEGWLVRPGGAAVRHSSRPATPGG